MTITGQFRASGRLQAVRFQQFHLTEGESAMANGIGLASVNSVVVLMLENRSFDHMLGYLYPGNVTPSGQAFEGLSGTESNPGSNGQPITVFKIEPTTPNVYYMPGADPGEG